ncbi:hypothetical protein [Calothrix sp. 336/3]|uniref:hypothetical protein n=1 Tax=Calothrix sp. 336/3 TaxID=1337936 RepID=UPI0004E374F3|nr:hypothetical protein [Calothrix sp. 336/3]AKG21471.1 hypothetical protein IJ00_09380 [Calothrix sp. 336/3]
MQDRIIKFQYEFDVTGRRVPVRTVQSNGDGFINCLDLTKILLEIEHGKVASLKIKPEEIEKITTDIIQTHEIRATKEFYAESGQGVEFLLHADQFSQKNNKEYERLIDWLYFWQQTAKATILERIGEHLAFMPLLDQYDKLLETEQIDVNEKQTLTGWLKSYCGISEASLLDLINNKIRRSISEALKTTKQREPDENESGIHIYNRSEFALGLSTIRQLIYGDGFIERFESYFYKLSGQKRDRNYQVKQKFYEYRDAGKLKNISEADLKVAVQYIWGTDALKHTGASQLPYSVDLFKRLLRDAEVTGRS